MIYSWLLFSEPLHFWEPVRTVLKFNLVCAEALRAMEKVASHINDMQKIYEDFGPVFDQLAAEQNSPDKEVTFTPLLANRSSLTHLLIHSLTN